jgi:hypothetical protein
MNFDIYLINVYIIFIVMLTLTTFLLNKSPKKTKMPERFLIDWFYNQKSSHTKSNKGKFHGI